MTTAVSGGSVGTPAAGIAITGNSATPDQGTYQYSTDNGTTWISIPATGLGDTNAIVIPTTAELRFVPVANFKRRTRPIDGACLGRHRPADDGRP